MEVQGFLIFTCLGNNNASPLIAANTYSLLAELNHATEFGNVSMSERTGQIPPFESEDLPFDHVYCAPPRALIDIAQSTDSLEYAAKCLSLESFPDIRAALRTSRALLTPREQLSGRSLTLKKLGHASLADHKREFIHLLAVDLAKAIRRHWLIDDNSADWGRLVREEQRAASVPKLIAAVDGEPGAPQVVAPINEATSLVLRGRFKKYMSPEFTSEVLRQVQRLLLARDDRGRPQMLARDAKQIADAALALVSSLVVREKDESRGESKFSNSPVLRSLIVVGSERILGHAVEKFDFRQPELFLHGETFHELVMSECNTLLTESLNDAELSAAIAELIELDVATSQMLESATINLLQCCGDRRIVVFAPNNETPDRLLEKLQSARPLAAFGIRTHNSG